ncbi:MAG: AI-2E family transporter [Actinobacteria bacterium]|nr:AI-2E family transporter [Actinomycetota bacterium]
MVSRDKTGERRQLIAYGVSLVVSLTVGLLIAYELISDLELVAIAVLIAVVLRSVVSAVGRIGAPPWIALIITLIAIGAIGAFLWLVLLPSFLQQAQTFASSVPGYLELLSNSNLSSRLPASMAGYLPELSDLSQSLAERLSDSLSPVLSSLPQFLTGLTEVTVRALIALVLALYMAYDPGTLISGMLRLVPDRRRESAKALIQDFGVRLRGWVVGTGLAMLIVGVGAGVGLWAIDIPLAASFGFLAGLLEIIPYFGPIAGALLPTLVAFTVSPIKALLVVGLFVLLHLLDANLIQPQILGRHVRLHPVVIIVSFLFLGCKASYAA